MKKIFLFIILVIILNADDNKTMTDEEFLKKIQESQQRQEKSLAEIEKTDKFIQKLEVIKKDLEVEKLKSKQREDKK